VYLLANTIDAYRDVFNNLAYISELEKFFFFLKHAKVPALVEADVWIWLQFCLVIALLVRRHLGKFCKCMFETKKDSYKEG